MGWSCKVVINFWELLNLLSSLWSQCRGSPHYRNGLDISFAWPLNPCYTRLLTCSVSSFGFPYSLCHKGSRFSLKWLPPTGGKRRWGEVQFTKEMYVLSSCVLLFVFLNAVRLSDSWTELNRYKSLQLVLGKPDCSGSLGKILAYIVRRAWYKQGMRETAK